MAFTFLWGSCSPVAELVGGVSQQERHEGDVVRQDLAADDVWLCVIGTCAEHDELVWPGSQPQLEAAALRDVREFWHAPDLYRGPWRRTISALHSSPCSNTVRTLRRHPHVRQYRESSRISASHG